MTQKISIKIENEIFEGFDNINVSRNIEELCGNFTFEVFDENIFQSNFKPSKTVQIFIEDQLFLTGIIDSRNINYTNTSFSYSVSGRDRTSIIVDNSIEGNINFTAPVALELIVAGLIGKYDNQVFIPPAEAIEPFEADEIPSGDEGLNLFEFIEKLARQRGLLLRTNEYGYIVMDKNPGPKYDFKLLHEKNNINNNILQGSFNQDYAQRYKRYSVISQSNFSSGIFSDSSADYNNGSVITDDNIDVYPDKFLQIEAEMSNQNTSNSRRALWEMQVRAARSEIYSCTVSGFTGGKNDIWNVNRLVDVKDDDCEINDTLLIKSINFNYSTGTGATTDLELVDKNAYLAELT